MENLNIRDWLKRDYWTLLEAFCVIRFGVSPEQMLQMHPSLDALYDLADFDLAIRSIQSGTLEGLNPEFKTDKPLVAHTIMVKPLDFLRWCQQKEVALSARVMAELTEEERQYIAAEQEEYAFKNINQRHRERSRALAEYLWQQEPTLTIEDMIHHDAINGIACENRTYAAKTLREWLKDLCPNRQPGRRPVQKSA